MLRDIPVLKPYVNFHLHELDNLLKAFKRGYKEEKHESK